MKALSVRQPWAWLIVNGFKPVENRSWPTKVRGRVLVHASKGMTHDEYWEVKGFLYQLAFEDRVIPVSVHNSLPPFEELERGGIVGAVDIVDCVTDHPSPFFFGKHGFVLANPEVLPFRPCKGKLGFFSPEVA